MVSELPGGWATCSVGDIFDIVGGGTPPAADAGNFSNAGTAHAWLTPADLSGYKKKLISHGARDLSAKGMAASSAKLMPAGSVLFTSRAPIGYVAIADGEISTNQGFKSFILPDDFDPSYVYYYLKSIRNLAESRGTGTTFKELSGAATKELPFVIAPLAEQKRIAQKLDALLAQVDTLKARIDAIPALLKRFRQSVLSAAVSGRLTSQTAHGSTQESRFQPPLVFFASEQGEKPIKWKWEKLADLATLESGHTPRKSVPKYWDGGDVPWISLQDIRAADGKEIFETKFKPTMLGIQNSSARLLPKGTVCFSRDISVGFVTVMGRSMATTQHFANWICGDELSPRYLMYAFMAGRDHLLKSGQGSTVKTIYMPALKELRLRLPPLSEQIKIVRRVEQLFAYADQLEAKVAAAQQRIDALTQSLLAKAFRGELVPQDPSDEPASVLLDRIRARRAATPKPKRGRKAATS
ncbi:restriction endonuclease subunit S [Xanthomonas oryzae pv. oryzae]|uniref:restriction endonuclease subunit S n=1 Tax=Xanthomonas oryzae TaxID=347 RepID=UPI0008598D1F|nr:restriction endonuclease subunit S [Xanthomonas oryzae]OLH92121.1 hypothetical protein DXO216_04290 [Xanthomonas oryzae pv. oryzae]OLK11028.1 hypothetical protein IXO599_00820 [Xanthomonas oryzae pv. oryzae]RBL06797.1 restriction endonuclease subunit S [Xanthomonas oryzae pv. oryzae]UWZ71193.1 hypothetical protein BHL62_07960 [Xanthomonas oryzae pv. oryzae]UXV89747.1 restriction endonuclease subunit S [Xanthomonas oryzae pv. oryzae]